MRARYQHGYLRFVKRKNGSLCWEFMWREQEPSGKRVHRTAVIGTAEQFPTEELAQEAVTGLRMQINQTRNRQREQPILVADLIDHYIATELSAEQQWRSYVTQIVYREFLKRRIKPHWGPTNWRYACRYTLFAPLAGTPNSPGP
jgi:hypothetical protein